MTISFGDNVRVLSTPETETLGLTGKEGQVYGETTPSITNVDVIGNIENDFALNVFLDDLNKDYWFTPQLLELIDHGEGNVIEAGNIRAVRKADGSWEESEINRAKKWWQIWR